MTQYRLRVTFSNERHLFGPRQYERELADEFTDWQPNQAHVQALGEKLIKDGVWVTVDPVDIHQPSETFLVPPSRIREVQIESAPALTVQEVADAVIGSAANAGTLRRVCEGD